ncbi:methylcobamide--CoM methyltransferase [Ammoniphilus sp. YIM 78166]|uniref:methylcobamide--CoM methyltransferase n=1 Tax=Ammoniphilus sp. YIM 78166 TaxID=1644106 RepID=UPI001F0E8CD2|nr:methylcobamide--CoM methyltransferase [Ammoniphilus sp. YIM 78166]
MGVHICRGNWSTQENVLLSGPYTPLMPYLSQMDVDQLILEFATPRAGELDAVTSLEGKELGLGAVNPRTEDIETVEQVVEKGKEAARLLSPEKIFLNPDCGFGTFAQRPMNTPERAMEKLRTLVQAAQILRQQ